MAATTAKWHETLRLTPEEKAKNRIALRKRLAKIEQIWRPYPDSVATDADWDAAEERWTLTAIGFKLTDKPAPPKLPKPRRKKRWKPSTKKTTVVEKPTPVPLEPRQPKATAPAEAEEAKWAAKVAYTPTPEEIEAACLKIRAANEDDQWELTDVGWELSDEGGDV